MVLEIPGKLFGQEDVRETAVATTGTAYVSIPGCAFTPVTETGDYTWTFSTGVAVSTGDVVMMAAIQIPDGATVTAAVVYGSGASIGWTLRRVNSAGTGSIMADTTAHGTEDTSISNAIIDNSTFSYFFEIQNIAAGDVINGARITYTI